jgi:tRNA 2-thiouridine synthesizing protein E
MGNIKLATDAEGYLLNLTHWNQEVATQIASKEGITLTDAHWEIINLIRNFYHAFEHSPAMRPLVKYTEQKLGTTKGKSVYLLALFPGSPAKLAAKIAGLPKPPNCL